MTTEQQVYLDNISEELKKGLSQHIGTETTDTAIEKMKNHLWAADGPAYQIQSIQTHWEKLPIHKKAWRFCFNRKRMRSDKSRIDATVNVYLPLLESIPADNIRIKLKV